MKLTNLIAAGLTATLLGTGISYAQTTPADVEVIVKNEMVAQMDEVMALVEELKAEGYTYIEIRRTMLGRAKVMAEGPDGTREIVLSTTTGEVMRDAMHDGVHMAGHEHMEGDMEEGMGHVGDMGDDMGSGHGGDMGSGHGGGMGGSMGGMSGN